MSKAFKYIVFTFLVWSCQDLQPIPAPGNLIERDKMEDIIYNVSLLNAARGFNVQRLKKIGVSPDSYIYEKYGVDSLQYVESIKYYAQDLDEYREMYERVQNRLIIEQKKVDSIYQIEKKIEDSLRRVRSKEAKKRDSIKKLNRPQNSQPPRRQRPTLMIEQQ